jgi:uncharacterized protein YcbK (DUF882 family)
MGFATTLATALPVSPFAAVRNSSPSEKTLSFYNIHTDERLRTVYWYKGMYISEALDEINYLMRDHRTNDTHFISVRLLDLLHDIHRALETRQFFHIVSGYRSPRTNGYLYRHSAGVARNSLHMYGRAVDIRVPHRDVSFVYDVARSLKRGGVGNYLDSNFTHVDVGSVRYW